MPFFSKKKYDDLDDVSLMTEEEKKEALLTLENRRFEINAELEALMHSFAKLTKNRKIARRRYKMGKAPNDFRPSPAGEGGPPWGSPKRMK